jgi:hypothetical protein
MSKGPNTADVSIWRSSSFLEATLTLVKRIVELHVGSVDVHSEGEGRGSTSEVRLPLAEAHNALDRASSSNPPTRTHGTRIQVVDDNRVHAASRLTENALWSAGAS